MKTTSALRAVRSRDPRFDGLFFYGVTTTGIFCRPSCPAAHAKVEHIRFFPTADAALTAGFRCCKRCRPGSSPGAPEWNIRNEIARRAVRLIADGATDGGGVGALARSLDYSERQIRRLLIAELGASPVALARSRRANAAHILLATTDLSNAEVAFAAGFRSLRQFHEVLRAIYDRTPTELRSSTGRAGSDGVLSLKLGYRTPLALDALFECLAADARLGVAHFDGATYRRAISLPRGTATIAIAPGPANALKCDLVLGDLRDLPIAVSRVRRFLDLDGDALAVYDVLADDPRMAPLVVKTPGLRLLGSIDPIETLCALIAATTQIDGPPADIATLVATADASCQSDKGGLRPFPSASAILGLDLGTIGWSSTRRVLLTAALEAIERGTLDLSVGGDPDVAFDLITSIAGMPHSVGGEVRRRIFSDPDVVTICDPTLRATAESWRPWRSYAEAYLGLAHSSIPPLTQEGPR